MPPQTRSSTRRSAARRVRLQNQTDLPLFAQPAPFLVDIAERLWPHSRKSQPGGETQKQTPRAKTHNRRKLWKLNASNEKLDCQLQIEDEVAVNHDDVIHFHKSTTPEENEAILREYREQSEEEQLAPPLPAVNEKELCARDLPWICFKLEQFHFESPSAIFHKPTIFAWRGWEPPTARPHETIEAVLGGAHRPFPQPFQAQQADSAEQQAPLHASLPLTLGPLNFILGPSPLTWSPDKLDSSSLHAVSQQAQSQPCPIIASSPHQPSIPRLQSQDFDSAVTRFNRSDEPQHRSSASQSHKSTRNERDLFQRLNGPDGIANPGGPCEYCYKSGKECRVMISEVGMPARRREYLRCNHCCRRKAGGEACNIAPDEVKRRSAEKVTKQKLAKAKREATRPKTKARQ